MVYKSSIIALLVCIIGFNVLQAMENNNKRGQKRPRSEEKEKTEAEEPARKRKRLSQESYHNQDELNTRLNSILGLTRRNPGISSHFTLAQAQEDINRGAAVNEGTMIVDFPVILAVLGPLARAGDILPLMLLLRNGADINTRDLREDITPIEALFGSLPFCICLEQGHIVASGYYDLREEKKQDASCYHHGERYSASDWRSWPDDIRNRALRDLDFSQRLARNDLNTENTQYPEGPFINLGDWQHAELCERLNLIRTELLNWFLDQGANINDTNDSGFSLLDRTFRSYNNAISEGNMGQALSLQYALLWLILNGATWNKLLNQAQTVIRHLFPNEILQNIILGQEEAAIKGLQTLSKDDLLIIEQALSIAAARGQDNILDFIIRNLSSDLRGQLTSNILEAIVIAAGMGKLTTFTKLVDFVNHDDEDFDFTINEAFVRAAAQGQNQIVEFILRNNALAHLIGNDIIYNAFLRAARQGHLDIIDTLWNLLEERLYHSAIIDPSIPSLSKIVTQAILMAAVRGNIKVAQFLLNHAEILDLAINTRTIGERLRNILNNPYLSDEEDAQFRRIARALDSYQHARVVQRILLPHRVPSQTLPQPPLTRDEPTLPAPISFLPQEIVKYIIHLATATSH